MKLIGPSAEETVFHQVTFSFMGTSVSFRGFLVQPTTLPAATPIGASLETCLLEDQVDDLASPFPDVY